MSVLRIGSRGSDLALWQAHHVRNLLQAAHPKLEIEIEIIQTMGDRVLDSSLSLIGGKGVFTKEIENALLDGRIDLAVHSLKDLPTTIDPDLTIAAIPARAAVEDVFLSKDPHARLLDLPDGARIATGSLRRKAQLLSRRPDFQIVDIRGNVPTRIQKMLASDWEGMILAAAGVERLGLMDHVNHKISLEWVLPAVGQGALGLQCRSNDSTTFELLKPLHHADTFHAVMAERALLREMGGGCQVPIGAHAKIMGDELEISGCVVSLDGTSVIRAVQTGMVQRAESVGEELAIHLLKAGGAEILESVFRLQTAEEAVQPHPKA